MEIDELLDEYITSIEADPAEESEAQELISVSSGDSVSSGNSLMELSETMDYSELVFLLQEQNELLTTSQETQALSIWEKPLGEYTVTESLLLLLVLCAFGIVIYKFLGGIMKCTLK